MPRLAREAGVQERANQLVGELDADDATAEHEHVHVVVLDALVRRVRVMAETSANARNPVRDHRRADAAAAEEDAALGPRLADGRGDGLRVVGIVHRILAVSTHVDHLEMLGGQERLHRLLQLEAGMIRADGHAHRDHLLALAICALAASMMFSGTTGLPASGEIVTSPVVDSAIDRASYGTGHGLASQISAAYSAMVRSLENLPEAATFRIALRAHPFGSV